jgi:hypothetical protein
MIKMRLFTSVIASAIFLAASAASAATVFNVTADRSTDNLNPGDTVTLSIRLTNGVGVFGLGASAYGYNEQVIDFTTGSTVASINHAVAIPAVGAFSGLTNTLTNPLSETSIGASGNRVLIFNGVGLTATNTNALDPGLNGAVGGNDAQMRITFTAIGEGTTNIIIGTGYNGDGEVLAGGVTDQSSNTSIAITVVPEPGTALLMGLGLAGLAAAGRKE